MVADRDAVEALLQKQKIAMLQELKQSLNSIDKDFGLIETCGSRGTAIC